MIDIPDAVNRARELLDEKRFDAAIELLRECHEACPDDEFLSAELAEAHSTRGFHAVRQGDAATAREDFEVAIGFSPLPEARLGLAQFEIEAGNLNQAGELVEEIIRESPDFFPAREVRAKLCVTLGDPAGAEEQYRVILQEFPVPRVFLSLASLLDQQDRKEEARQILFEGLSTLPDDADLVLAAARYSDPEQRWQLLNKGIALAPRSFDLWFERACAACQQNDAEEAALSMNQCLELDASRARSSWKEEVSREGSPTIPFADHPYLADLLSD